MRLRWGAVMGAEFWITTLAIVVGPLAAVLVTVWLERRRKNYDRKHQVFRALMKSRRTWGSPEHVEALNLVEIEFHGNANVLSAYKALFEYFVKGIPRRENETEKEFGDRRTEEHSGLLSKLLAEISKVLGYRHDQFEILRGGYSPELHGQIEEDQTKIRRLFAGLHDGTTVLPMAVVDYRHPEKLLKQARDMQVLLEAAKEAKADD